MTKLTWSELTLPPINLWSLPNNRITFVKTKTEDLVEAMMVLAEALLCVPASQRDVFENIINKIKEI